MEIVIKPKQKWRLLDLEELWRYRDLFYIFTWRDIKVRYRQTFLGILWVILQPLISMGIFTFFFGKLAKIPSEGLPYELFVFIGLVFWTFFSEVLSRTSNSMVESGNIIKKVYFPRIILPFSSIITSFVDFSINFIILLAIALYFGFIPSLSIFVITPLALLLSSLTASGLGFFLASFNVRYRDVKYILPFFIQLLLFLTPVIYPSSTIGGPLRYLFYINPMTGVIESVRSLFLSSRPYDYTILLFSFMFAIIIFFLGLAYFKSTEKFIADTI